MNKKENKISNLFKNIILTIIDIFKYAILGIRVCTIDLIKYLFSPKDKKKITKKELISLEKEREELLKDLQGSGATRSKSTNVYVYKVLDSNGTLIKGTMEGYSKLDINSFLVSEGYNVYSIKTSTLINLFYKDVFSSDKISSKDLVFLLTELSTYLDAGIKLNDAIKILSRQVSNKSEKRALKAISYELTLGSSFSSSLLNQGRMFPPLLINMVKSSEVTGTLTETLQSMAKYYSEVEDTKRDAKSALTYPLIITVFATLVMAFILIFIIPKFVDIYTKNNIEINGITLFIVNFSNFLKSNILTILSSLIIIIILFMLAYHNIPKFRRSIQVFLMHIPFIKNIIIYNELTIFTKTFASLLKNNVFITDSINILSQITSNEVYKEILLETISNVIKGEKISLAFKDHWAIPEAAYYMIITGEETGELAKMMQKVSEYYAKLHKNIVSNLKSFIEPVLISLLAIVVGGIIIAVVIPMFSMYENLM